MKPLLLLFLLCYSTWLPGMVDIPDTLRSIHAVRVINAPKIDGRLKEPEWQLAQESSDFIQSRPEEGKPSTQKTEVKVLYTDFAIYIGAWCYDTQADSILRQLGQRDEPELNADNFYFKVDPYNNQQDAYQFGVYASGVQLDSKFSDFTFDAVWNSEVSSDAKRLVCGNGNTVFSIPFSCNGNSGMGCAVYPKRQTKA
jgi:hypothetical protein